MYRWLLPPKLIIASLSSPLTGLFSDTITIHTFWDQWRWSSYWRSISDEKGEILRLYVCGMEEQSLSRIHALWGEVPIDFWHNNANFWGKCIFHNKVFMYIFNIYYFIGPFQKLDMIEFFMAHSSNIFLISSRVIFRIMRGFYILPHTCIDARLIYFNSQDGLLMLTTVWFKPNVKCLLCLEHLHRRFWMSRHQGQSFIL